jgi:hypothetical protein
MLQTGDALLKLRPRFERALFDKGIMKEYRPINKLSMCRANATSGPSRKRPEVAPGMEPAKTLRL